MDSIKEYQKLKKTLRGFYKLQKEEEKLFREMEGEAAALLRGGWDPEYGDALRRVDLFELEQRVAELEELKPAEEGASEPAPGKRRGKGKGLVLLSLGFLLAGFLVPSVAGIASAALGFAGIGTWFFFTQKGRNMRKEAPGPQDLYREALKGVRDSLQGLPLKIEVLEESPLDYLQKLGNVKEIHEEFCMRREHVRKLKRHITSQERTIRETAVGFSGGIPVTLDDSLPVLMQSLSRARTQKSETQRAARELEKVNGVLREKAAREEEIYRGMEDAVKKIEVLGSGDYMKGMDLLEEGRRAEGEAENLERQLSVRDGESAGKKREALIKRYGMAKRQLELCRRLLTKEEKELVRHGPSFPVTVEEPVQRYLLYGGKRAEEFLIQSLKAVEDLVDWGRISENSGLPVRVRDFLPQWWEDRFQEELPARAYEAPGSPYLILSEAGEVKLGLPPQTLQLPEGTSQMVARMGEGRIHYPVHCRIRLDCQGEVSFSSLLEGDKGREILDLMKGARHCVRLNLEGKGIKSPRLVKRGDGGVALEIEKGVRCITCGEKLSGQELWNKSHYPKCKSLVPNIETLPVRGTLIWPGDSTAQKLPRDLRFARELVSETLTLYTEKNASVSRVMEGLIQDGEYLRQGVQALLSREKQIFMELLGWKEASESLSSREGDEPSGKE